MAARPDGRKDQRGIKPEVHRDAILVLTFKDDPVTTVRNNASDIKYEGHIGSLNTNIVGIFK